MEKFFNPLTPRIWDPQKLQALTILGDPFQITPTNFRVTVTLCLQELMVFMLVVQEMVTETQCV